MSAPQDLHGYVMVYNLSRPLQQPAEAGDDGVVAGTGSTRQNAKQLPGSGVASTGAAIVSAGTVHGDTNQNMVVNPYEPWVVKISREEYLERRQRRTGQGERERSQSYYVHCDQKDASGAALNASACAAGARRVGN